MHHIFLQSQRITDLSDSTAKPEKGKHSKIDREQSRLSGALHDVLNEFILPKAARSSSA